jgi:hypothetical protein
MKPLALLLAAQCAVVWAQAPHVQNARFETRSVGAGLDATINRIAAGQNGPAWLGYGVPIVAGEHHMCCFGCSLEGHSENTQIAGGNRTVQLEGSQTLVVLLRVAEKKVSKVRTYTLECDLDAGGLPFIWLTDVRPADSVRYLAGLASDSDRANSAVAALAMHADPAADTALEQLVAPSQPESLRRHAVFWLGNARGRRGYEILARVLRDDPSDKVREHAVFALTQNKEPAALDLVIRTAHDDKSAHVRGQALFWLAQRASRKLAEAAITDAIEKDPETDVKKKAVFALTQMPENEGVPLLIQLARTNRNPVVRKQAIFWLGQSKDPRALGFFEEVLTK